MGPDYAHAEARKSPALDGKVERDSEGKEVRYPVKQEKIFSLCNKDRNPSQSSENTFFI